MEERNKKELTLDCKVSRGLFANERSVTVELPNGQVVAAFVDRRDVVVEKEPQGEEEVRGRVKVSMVEEQSGSAIIDLPQPGIAAGPRVRVPHSLLK